MNFKLNCSLHLSMSEITKKLFNRNFLSDIQFCVGDKIIYAHSLELMKRSVVFERQLEETLGEKKLIPITDCTYETFLEFVRFIYTDECDINVGNGMELLKLAIKYQIIILENQIINSLGSCKWGFLDSINSFSWNLELFEYCVVEKYQIPRGRIDQTLPLYFGIHLSRKTFSTLHPNAVNEILQLDEIEEGVTEVQIFNALAGWIKNYCKQHEMSLSQRRQQFDDLVKKIRFPVMTSDEIRECVKKYPGLLNESDCMSIGKQVFFGSENGNDLWTSKRRTDYERKEEWREFNRDAVFETKFSVSNETNLIGIRIGAEQKDNDIKIEIAANDTKTIECEKIVFIHPGFASWGNIIINLGDSIILKPNVEYTIAVKYLETTDEDITILCRKENVMLEYNDPDNSIQIIKAGDNMWELIFKASGE